MRICIIGGSPECPSTELIARLIGDADYTIATDAGVQSCLDAGLPPDILIGDFDSADHEALEEARRLNLCTLVYPREKDETDLGLALTHVRGRFDSVDELVLSRVSQGRLDHMLGVMGLLAQAADLAPRVEENDFTMWILSADARESLVLQPADVGKTLSIIALMRPACISAHGMRWNLCRATLEPLSDRGISNIVLEPVARIDVYSGVACVILQRSIHG